MEIILKDISGHTSFKLSIINRSGVDKFNLCCRSWLNSSNVKKWTHQKITLLEYILIKVKLHLKNELVTIG